MKHKAGVLFFVLLGCCFSSQPSKAHELQEGFSSINGFQNSYGEDVILSAIHWGSFNTIFGSSSFAVIGGGNSNVVKGVGPTVGGGYENWADEDFATVSGGLWNWAGQAAAAVGGGLDNYASSPNSTISGGKSNQASGTNSTVSGGVFNKARGYNSSVGGGNNNVAKGDFSRVGGGLLNKATGAYTTIPGGTRAKARHSGSFVWGADASENTVSFANNSFTVRSEGGARFYTANGIGVGAQLKARGTSWTSLSDRESKDNFEEIDNLEILQKLAAMPVTSWNYKHDPGRRYIGPTAQDFMEAFNLGNDDKGINTLDADGVAFAAIKGLVEELKERDKKIAALEEKVSELDSLKDKIASIEENLNALSLLNQSDGMETKGQLAFSGFDR